MKRILVIQTASIGDVILATPVLEALHEQYPQASIDILVKKGNEALFSLHPFINQVWTWDKQNRKFGNLFRLIRQIRKVHYDLLINIQRFFSSGLITVFAGAKTTSGFRKNPLSVFFSNRVAHVIGGIKIHEVDRNLALIPGNTKPYGSGKVKLYPSQADYQKIIQYQGGKYACIAPASLWFTKQYPKEKWVELINALPGDIRVLLLGSQADKMLNEGLRTRVSHPETINLSGKLSLLESAALMEGAVMNFVNDSAPLHLCTAMNAPVTAIFCSTIQAFGFGPYGSNGKVVETGEELLCRPCGLHGLPACPEKHFLCAMSIDTKILLRQIPHD